MPMNKMNRGVAPAASPGRQLCQAPHCDKLVLKGARFCSMCLAKLNSGMKPGRKKKRPAVETPK